MLIEFLGYSKALKQKKLKFKKDIKKRKLKFKKEMKRDRRNTRIRARSALHNMIVKLRYTKAYDSAPIVDNTMLVESYLGDNFSGNVYYLMKECMKLNPNLKVYVSVNKKAKKNVLAFLKFNDIQVELVSKGSVKYALLLASVKYLLNNSTFPYFFVKKKGQVYVNTWHGTPLKCMGRSNISEPEALGNVQRNLAMADYVTYPNEFTYEKFMKDYMLDNMTDNNMYITGYPRNTIFFDKENEKKVRKIYGLENKRVYVYMPTWRGLMTSKNNLVVTFIEECLNKIEHALAEDEVMYVKLHSYFSSSIHYENYTKIKAFPVELESYEFLAIADVLITDYSSVMFDYACSRKKVVLFTYDEEEYLSTRGMYLSLDELPFARVKTAEALIDEIKKVEVSYDDTAFMKRFCALDSLHTTKNIAKLVLKNEMSKDIIHKPSRKNNKENVLIFPGAFIKNGITSAFFSVAGKIDLKRRNYFTNYYTNVLKANKYKVNELPEKMEYIPMVGEMNMTFREAICHKLYFSFKKSNNYIQQKLKNIFDREVKRVFPAITFDTVIHFSGYERKIAHFYDSLDAQKVIYLHSDMQKEYELRKNFHYMAIMHAYRHFDKIAIVNEHIKDCLLHWGIDEKKIVVTHNIQDDEAIIRKAEMEFTLDDDTNSNRTFEEMQHELQEETRLRIITIGRFSKEKSHDRLIEAFEKIRDRGINASLWIVGGSGNLYYDTVAKARASIYKDAIFVIRSLSNPYSLLKQMNLFVLSSLYEGLPMVIFEALILKVAVLSTDLPGVKLFFENGYGSIVPNSVEGLEQGLIDFNDGKLIHKEIDITRYNQGAIAQFEAMLEKKK